jgi:hypothetical protein
MGPPLEGLGSALGVKREVTRRAKVGDWEAAEIVINYEYINMIDSPMIRRGYDVYHS